LNFFLLFRIRPHFPLFDVFSGKCVRAISRDFPHIVNKPKVNNMHWNVDESIKEIDNE
jgi:hypothetical protein